MAGQINFSSNWNNKLNNRFYFTTIRAAGHKEYRKGKSYVITHKQYYMGRAVVEDITKKKGKDFTATELAVDTGRDKETALNILSSLYGSGVKEKEFVIILLRWI